MRVGYVVCLLLQLFLGVRSFVVHNTVHLKDEVSQRKLHSAKLAATVQSEADVTPLSASSLPQKVLNLMSSLRGDANQYADQFGLTSAEAAFYALFRSIRDAPVPLNLNGETFVLRCREIEAALKQPTGWVGFFTMADLEKAVTDDFLDAARGSTDNRKGWKITDVSQPRGDSFEEARMTFEDVTAALEKGTVIFNAAGAHIPKLAGPSLACTDGTLLPCALNLYVTAPGQRTSAPPHTDKQDVAVVQTSGRKHWRVYSPPQPSLKPGADPFARGKGDDSLHLYNLPQYGCQLLLETVLSPGDVLFIPAGFPHTTSTVVSDADMKPSTHDAESSIHLTLGIDHHIWELDYVSARRLGLRRAGVQDNVLYQTGADESPFVGKVNELPLDVWRDLMAELPLGLLDDDDAAAAPFLNEAVTTLERISLQVDATTASRVNNWEEVVKRFQQEGRELLETHRDMYLAAIEEGRTREMEDAMTAHIKGQATRSMSPERMQRLSLFRVKRFYDRINESKASLQKWSFEGKAAASGESVLSADWALTLPVKVGDQVEADLGGAFFSASVTRASGGTYDVQFFDGDSETDLERSQIRLLTPPVAAGAAAEADTSSMTPKQLKRWKKQQEKAKRLS